MTVHDSVLLEVPEALVEAMEAETLAVVQAQPASTFV